MARENRGENRNKAKAENENKPTDENKVPDFGELADDFDSDQDQVEDLDEIEGSEDNKEQKKEENKEEKKDGDKNVSKGEAEDKNKADTIGIDKDAEEDGEKKADDKATEEAKSREADEKKLKDEADAKAAEDAKKKPEPTAEEKLAIEAAAKKKQEEAPKTLTDEEAGKLFSDWRSTTETLLAEHHYKMTEEQVAELNENPAAYIPKAMARVYLDTISASFQQFVNYLPRMVHQVLEARETNSQQENAFFNQWPDLKAHKDTVLRLGAAYRQSNPAASPEDFINEVGAQAMVALRMNPQLQQLADKNSGQNTDADEKPFKPAGGGPGGGEQKRNSNNPIDQLLDEFSQTEEEVDDN